MPAWAASFELVPQWTLFRREVAPHLNVGHEAGQMRDAAEAPFLGREAHHFHAHVPVGHQSTLIPHGRRWGGLRPGCLAFLAARLFPR